MQGRPSRSPHQGADPMLVRSFGSCQLGSDRSETSKRHYSALSARLVSRMSLVPQNQMGHREATVLIPDSVPVSPPTCKKQCESSDANATVPLIDRGMSTLDPWKDPARDVVASKEQTMMS